jgi:hypothetical protein
MDNDRLKKLALQHKPKAYTGTEDSLKDGYEVRTGVNRNKLSNFGDVAYSVRQDGHNAPLCTHQDSTRESVSTQHEFSATKWAFPCGKMY